tara:strand:+ start:1 stop:1275 length:1275 start_codon:yes stop_codon:yes gene_type:complete
MGMSFEIIKDGALDINALMDAFSGQQLTLEMLQGASDIFTVRALRSFGLLIGAADEYGTMLTDVTNSQGALQEVVEMQMTSFTAMFAKLRQELLAPLRTPEVMEQVRVMVDGLIEMFNTLKPALINTVILSLKGFSDIVSGEKFLSAVKFLADGLFTIFQALKFIGGLAAGPGGIIVKAAFAFKLATVFVSGFAMSLQQTARQLSINAIEIIKLNMAMVGKLTTDKLAIQWNQRNALSLNQVGLAAQFASATIMGIITAGMMFGATDSPMMMGITALIGLLMALNTTLMITEALFATFKYSLTSFQMVGVFAGLVAAMGLVAYGFREQRKAQMAEIENMSIADTGMFVGRKSYDTGGAVGPRHQLVYVEPGEQIISKTQGMAGMGGGITVNVGDVYAQDGTDFAQKLAEELPRALRVSSYAGGF